MAERQLSAEAERQALILGLRAREAAQEAYQLRPRFRYRPHPGQLAFHRAAHPIRALFPGNGFGKTTAAGHEVNWWLAHAHPVHAVPSWPIVVIWGCETYKQFRLLRAQLEMECLDRGWRFNRSDNCYTWPDGGELWLISYDASWEHVQGINPDLVAFDEEPPDRLWNEMQMRRRGRKKTRYLFTATATRGMTWMYEQLYKPWLEHHAAAGMDEAGAMAAQTHPLIWCWPRGGIHDNPGADASDRAWYESRRFASRAERQVRLFGGFADFSGEPVFDPDAIDAMKPGLEDAPSGQLVPADGAGRPLDLVAAPSPGGAAESRPEAAIERLRQLVRAPRFVFLGTGPMPRGRLTVFRPPDPSHRYVIGHDSAYGLASGDFDYAVVLDRQTGEQVAEAQGRWGDSMWDEVLYSLHRYYCGAFLLGEQQVGLLVMRRLWDVFGVTHQYRHKDLTTAAGNRPSDDLGHFRRTGDMIIPRLRLAIGGRTLDDTPLPPEVIVRSRELHRQLVRYQFRPRSSNAEITSVHDSEVEYGAPAGDHDDGVMALAYARMALAEVARAEPAEQPYAPGTVGQVLKVRERLGPKRSAPSAFGDD